MPAFTPHEFVIKWKRAEARERESVQEHFIDLCRLVTPAIERWLEKGIAMAPGWIFGHQYTLSKLDENEDSVTREVIRLRLPAGATNADVYRPVGRAQAPLVIVAHGFARHRRNMAGWGRHFARQGMVAVVPDLPSLSDHARNGRFLSELREYLLGEEAWRKHIDPARVGLVGFSAGGLASLLSAARSPGVTLWIGLDPVDRDGAGMKAAPLVQARAVVLTAEPSSCNAYGNSQGILSAFPRCEHFRIAGAVHVDAEWPTSWLAELVCGRSTAGRRAEFQARATKALQEAFALPGAQDP